MKRVVAFLLVLIMVLSLTGCETSYEKKRRAAKEEKIRRADEVLEQIKRNN